MTNTVALFVTCLVENIKPSVGFSTLKLLEDAGYDVVVPEAQVCCGQPNHNGGDEKNTRRTARKMIDLFSAYPYVVVPSGSCAGMLKHHYPKLFNDDAVYRDKAQLLASKVYELSQFLCEVADYKATPIHDAPTVSYHDACAGLRELDISQQPRNLLSAAGVTVQELKESEACCGFGGTFCVKYPAISARMAQAKIEDVVASETKMLVGGDLGCLLNLEGKMHRDGVDIEVKHFAELLAP